MTKYLQENDVPLLRREACKDFVSFVQKGVKDLCDRHRVLYYPSRSQLSLRQRSSDSSSYILDAPSPEPEPENMEVEFPPLPPWYPKERPFGTRSSKSSSVVLAPEAPLEVWTIENIAVQSDCACRYDLNCACGRQARGLSRGWVREPTAPPDLPRSVTHSAPWHSEPLIGFRCCTGGTLLLWAELANGMGREPSSTPRRTNTWLMLRRWQYVAVDCDYSAAITLQQGQSNSFRDIWIILLLHQASWPGGAGAGIRIIDIKGARSLRIPMYLGISGIWLEATDAE